MHRIRDDQNYSLFLSYIDCMGIIPKKNDICLVDIYHKHYSYGSKIFLVLMIRRGNNFGHRWCDALIVCSILPLSIFQKIWHISNEMDLILNVLCIQPSCTTCCVYKFSHGWSIQFEMINLDIQMDAWEINGNSFGHNFAKVWIR